MAIAIEMCMWRDSTTFLVCLLLRREGRGLWGRVFADKIYDARGVVDDHSQSPMDDQHLDVDGTGEHQNWKNTQEAVE